LKIERRKNLFLGEREITVLKKTEEPTKQKGKKIAKNA